MAHCPPLRLGLFLLALIVLLRPGLAEAAKPPVAEALKLKPVQSDIDYDIPSDAEIERCQLEPYKAGKISGWEVLDGDNHVLRRYLDTNADNKVDQWCYFKDGIEVYRDIDSNHNRQADQYRWLGTAGTRWALDDDEDGRIDRWKLISPEEVTEEAVLALERRDADRFKLLLLTPRELGSLGLGEDQAKQLAKRLSKTAGDYEGLLRTQDFVQRDAQWVNFGGTRPGLVPAGTDGAERDLHVYENVAAVIKSGETHDQLIIGTLVKVGDVWRLIDLPKSISDAQAGIGAQGFFFQASLTGRAEANVPVSGGLSARVQELISQMEQIDKDLLSATAPAELAPLNARRADVLEQLAAETQDKSERVIWLRQLADTVSAAAQSGEYPEGIQRLQSLSEKLRDQKASDDLIAYVTYRYLSAEYTQQMQQPDADFAKVQEQWLSNLQQFIQGFPSSPDAAEAMLQLAIAEEFAGNDEAAVNWYGRIAEDFPDSTNAAKAAGAKRRIESIGQPLVLSGQDHQGNTISTQAFRGKAVLVHYWGTHYSKCLTGLSVLKDMQAKYGKENLAIVGVNVDNDKARFEAYMNENPLPWPQLHAPGGLDSPLANQYGVLVLPTMILADQQGKVVNRNLDAGQVDSELRRLLR